MVAGYDSGCDRSAYGACMRVDDRPAALAVSLHRRGARFTVVGGTAQWLLGAARPPADLDLVVSPGSLPGLRVDLQALDAGVPRRLLSGTRCLTTWGPLDVFVDDRTPPHRDVRVLDCSLQVAT